MLVDRAYETVGLNKPMEVVLYIIHHTEPENLIFSRTYSKIQKDTKASVGTIAKVFRVLEENGAIEYLGDSRWKNNMIEGLSDTCEGPDFYFRIERD